MRRFVILFLLVACGCSQETKLANSANQLQSKPLPPAAPKADVKPTSQAVNSAKASVVDAQNDVRAAIAAPDIANAHAAAIAADPKLTSGIQDLTTAQSEVVELDAKYKTSEATAAAREKVMQDEINDRIAAAKNDSDQNAKVIADRDKKIADLQNETLTSEKHWIMGVSGLILFIGIAGISLGIFSGLPAGRLIAEICVPTGAMGLWYAANLHKIDTVITWAVIVAGVLAVIWLAYHIYHHDPKTAVRKRIKLVHVNPPQNP